MLRLNPTPRSEKLMNPDRAYLPPKIVWQSLSAVCPFPGCIKSQQQEDVVVGSD